jgi:glycosyltransferase involved in cell wall biosynthesis
VNSVPGPAAIAPAPKQDKREGAGRVGLLRTVHVVAGLDPTHGGPAYSVPALASALAGNGAAVTLLSVDAGDGRTSDGVRGYCERLFPADYNQVPLLRSLRCSSGLAGALAEDARRADVIHNHGLWLMPNVRAGRAARAVGRPLVVSPRGMLAPAALQFSRLKKRACWVLLQGSALRQAACIHATSEQEYEEIRAFGVTRPVAIVPNGIDLPELSRMPELHVASGRTVLSLGRIHPKKGLDRLLHAWARVEAVHPAWRLRIIGPAERGHASELQALASALGLTRVSIEGPLYGDHKTEAYYRADLFVLPTLNENFGLTVAEALAAGTPVIATKGAPWSGLEDEGCGWWIDHGVEPLAAALSRAMEMPREALKAMGARGRAWMARDFSWDRVARDMLDMYRWLALGAAPPATVRFD